MQAERIEADWRLLGGEDVEIRWSRRMSLVLIVLASAVLWLMIWRLAVLVVG